MAQVGMRAEQPRPAAPAPADRAAAQGETVDAKAGATDGFALLLSVLGGDAAPASQGDASVEGLAAGDGLMADAVDAARQGEAPDPRPDAARPSVRCGAMSEAAHCGPDAALAEHLQMLLNQVQHALSGRGMEHDSMLAETARIDGAAPAAQPLARRHGGTSAGGAGTGRADSITTGTAAMASATGAALAAPLAAARDGAALTPLQAPPGASPAAAGDARVALGEPPAFGHFAGQGSGDAPATALVSAWSGTASAPRARGGNADAQPGGGAGADAGLRAPSTQGADGTNVSGAADGQGADSFVEQLGEQIAFWVHQKSQHAEFTLDRDGQPVQVQVALTGDEARLTFLTDHGAAREALDAGVDELRTLLREQGLQLADLSVGIAGGQGGREGLPEQRQRGARASAHVTVADADVLAPARSAGQRALDVFV